MISIACLILCLLGSPILTIFLNQSAEIPAVSLTAVFVWYFASIILSVTLAFLLSKICNKIFKKHDWVSFALTTLLLLLFYSGSMAVWGGNFKLALFFETLRLMIQSLPYFFRLIIGPLLGLVIIFCIFIFSKKFNKVTHSIAFIITCALLGTDLIHLGMITAPHFKQNSAINVTFHSKLENKNHKPATVIHLILDEMSGKALLEDPRINKKPFYRQTDEGVYFSNAHSNSLSTHTSVRQILSGDFDAEKKTNTSAALLRSFENLGYDIHLYLNDSAVPCSIAPQAECFEQAWAVKNGLYKNNWQDMLFFEIKSLAKVFQYRMSFRALGLNTESITEDYKTSLKSSTPLTLFHQALEKIKTTSSPSYHLIHLLIPHSPFIHDEECKVIGDPTELAHEPESYQKNAETGYLRQLPCANKIATQLIQSLKEIKIYDDAFIIIQSDHGSRFRHPQNAADCSLPMKEYTKNASHIVLWLKPPHSTQSRIKADLVQALDLPATLAHYFELKEMNHLPGRDLLAPSLLPLKEVRIDAFQNCKKN